MAGFENKVDCAVVGESWNQIDFRTEFDGTRGSIPCFCDIEADLLPRKGGDDGGGKEINAFDIFPLFKEFYKIGGVDEDSFLAIGAEKFS